MKLLQNKYHKFCISIFFAVILIGCSPKTEQQTQNSSDRELIEAITYHHNFKVSAIIDELILENNIDKLIITKRIASKENKWTPLCFASFIGNREAVIELIEHGANINFKDANGNTPLMLASISGNIEEINILISNGSNIDEIDNNGSTALIHASTAGNLETVKFLVQNGCRLTPKEGQSALEFAKFHQRKEVVEYLQKIETKD